MFTTDGDSKNSHQRLLTLAQLILMMSVEMLIFVKRGNDRNVGVQIESSTAGKEQDKERKGERGEYKR